MTPSLQPDKLRFSCLIWRLQVAYQGKTIQGLSRNFGVYYFFQANRQEDTKTDSGGFEVKIGGWRHTFLCLATNCEYVGGYINKGDASSTYS